MGDHAKVGFFQDDGFCSLRDGPEDYIHGWADGYNSNADISVEVLVGDDCECGDWFQPATSKHHRPEPGWCRRCDRQGPINNEVTDER